VAWLVGQVFLLCLVSFLAGAAITAVAMRRKPAPAALAEPELAEEVIAEEVITEEESIEELDDPEAGEPVIIKASKKSMRYHTPDSPYYNRVKGELTFPSAEEAELAGYSAWNKTPARSSS
jgi:hypothetical protein